MMEQERLRKVRKILSEKGMEYTYTEEDGCASIDFLHRGLFYHIWEYADEQEPCGVETNLFHAGRSEEIEGDYDTFLSDEIRRW